MADLADVKLGNFGDVKLTFEGGALKLALEAGITVDQLLTLVENAIPGDFDNKLIDGLKGILAKV